MYTIDEFDKGKTKVLKYILYKKRTESEIRTKFSKEMEENLLEDIIEYLKEAKYIDDKEYIRKTINNFIVLKNLSIKELKKFISSGACSNTYPITYFNIDSASAMLSSKSANAISGSIIQNSAA